MTEIALPHSVEAETVVLGACIREAILTGTSEVAVRALSLLQAGHFYVFSHAQVFVAIAAVVTVGMPPTPQLVAEELKREGMLERVGGISFLFQIQEGVPYQLEITHYVETIRDTSALRDLAKLGDRISRGALGADDRAEVLLAEAQESIFRLAQESQIETKSSARAYREVGESVSGIFREWEAGNVVAIPTQIPELDARLNYGGLAAGDLVVLAARTSFGKSALALQIALSSARAGVPVLIFSLEMSAERLFIRNLASVSQVPHFKISPWTFQNNPGLADRVWRSVPDVAKLPIRVDHKTRKLRRLVTIATEWHRKTRSVEEGRKRALLITDYMQLVDNRMERRSRNDEVAGISMELKGLATEFGIPVIGVSQLTRSPAKDNRRPELPDLRESGQLEQDADLVLFPWSADGIKDERVRGMKLYCPKQRGGQVGWEIPVDFDGDQQWFFTEQMYAQERGEVAPTMDFNAD